MSKKSKSINRQKCLKPNELSYLLLISSVITGCTERVEKLSNYQEALDYCKNNPAYCKEADKLNLALSQPQQHGASGSFQGPPAQQASGGNNFLNYYLLYHLFFSRNSVNSSNYQNKFSNYDKGSFDKREKDYMGRGVYTPGYVSRMHKSISEGKTSFVSDSGKVFKSSQFKGVSKSSLTGKSISRGGFGTSGRSYGVGS